VNTIKPNYVKKRKIAENFFTLASCLLPLASCLLPLASCLAITTIFNANLLSECISFGIHQISHKLAVTIFKITPVNYKIMLYF
jgi:hypothetical protein